MQMKFDVSQFRSPSDKEYESFFLSLSNKEKYFLSSVSDICALHSCTIWDVFSNSIFWVRGTHYIGDAVYDYLPVVIKLAELFNVECEIQMEDVTLN